MRRKSTDNNEEPILNVVGELVALGPLRRDLLPLYQRWINDLGTMRTLGVPPLPMTSEKEQEWYDRQSKAEDDVPFTIYERETDSYSHGYALAGEATIGVINRRIVGLSALSPWPPLPLCPSATRWFRARRATAP